MPARMIDFDALWNSAKLADLLLTNDPVDYLWIYGIAEGNGVFELDAEAIWRRTCRRRPHHTPQTIADVLKGCVRAKLIFAWTDDATGKRLGYMVGNEKPGRRPPPKKMGRLHYPDPPQDLLAEYLATPSDPVQPSLLRNLGGARRKRTRSEPEAGSKRAGSGLEASRKRTRGEPEADSLHGVGLDVGLDLDRKGKGVGLDGTEHGKDGEQRGVSAPPSSSSPSSGSASLRPSAAPHPTAGQSGKKKSDKLDEKKSEALERVRERLGLKPSSEMRFGDHPELLEGQG